MTGGIYCNHGPEKLCAMCEIDLLKRERDALASRLAASAERVKVLEGEGSAEREVRNACARACEKWKGRAEAVVDHLLTEGAEARKAAIEWLNKVTHEASVLRVVNADLTRERDRLVDQLRFHAEMGRVNTRERAEAIEAVEARARVLEVALRPFALLADEPHSGDPNETHTACSMRRSDLQGANRALAATPAALLAAEWAREEVVRAARTAHNGSIDRCQSCEVCAACSALAAAEKAAGLGGSS